MHLDRVVLHPERYPTRDHYPFSLPILQQTPEIEFDAPVTLFVGENGTGKSTLLEAMAVAAGIHIWRPSKGPRPEVNRYEDLLPTCLSVKWAADRVPGSFFGAGIFRHFAESLDAWAAADPGQLAPFGGRSLLTQSHGQSLMSYFRNRYRIKGLYLLDEPETALSPRSQLELLRLLREMGTAGHAQFVVATHSPILLACTGARIYTFDRTPVQPVRYEQTEHYRLYRDFLADPEAYC